MRLRRGPQLVTRDTVRSSDVRQPVRPGTLWSELGVAPRYPTVERGIPPSWWPTAGATPLTTG